MTHLPAPQYASWNGLQSPDDFYTSEAARQAYRDHLAFMVGRRAGRWAGGRCPAITLAAATGNSAHSQADLLNCNCQVNRTNTVNGKKYR